MPRMASETASAERKISKSQRLWPIAIAALIIIASHRSRVASPDISHIDKVSHFMVYGLVATLTGRLGSGWRGAILAVLATSAFGVADEWHQSFVPGRSSEFADWVADTAGAALAVSLYYGWNWYRTLLETPLGRRVAPVGNS